MSLVAIVLFHSERNDICKSGRRTQCSPDAAIEKAKPAIKIQLGN